MSPRHGLVAIFIAMVWGVNFVVLDYGLREFPPLLLAALRFAVVGAFAPFLPRPRAGLALVVTVGMVLFAFQFGLLFSGMAAGVPAGLAAVALQVQAPLSLLLGAWLLREHPSARQVAGTCVALLGIILLVEPAQGGPPLLGLALIFGAGLSWAVGNLILRRIEAPDMMGLVAWISLVPPLPLLALSSWIDGPATIHRALSEASWAGLGSVLYVALGATLFAYGVWGRLLRIYSAATVAPFSILALPFAILSAFLLLGEQLSAAQMVASALVLAGLSLVALPPSRRRAFSMPCMETG
jgi:O-acetylserine/cysteine efflux transporter